MIKRKEQAEMKRKERERSLRAMHDPNAYKAVIIEVRALKFSSGKPFKILFKSLATIVFLSCL